MSSCPIPRAASVASHEERPPCPGPVRLRRPMARRARRSLDATLPCFCGAFGSGVPRLSPEDDPVGQSGTDLTMVTSETGH